MSEARTTIDLADKRVEIVLRVLGVDPALAADAFRPSRSGRPTRVPAYESLRARITVALRELRHGGRQLYLRDVAALVGAPDHSTVNCRIASAGPGTLTELEICCLRRGGEPAVDGTPDQVDAPPPCDLGPECGFESDDGEDDADVSPTSSRRGEGNAAFLERWLRDPDAYVLSEALQNRRAWKVQTTGEHA